LKERDRMGSKVLEKLNKKDKIKRIKLERKGKNGKKSP